MTNRRCMKGKQLHQISGNIQYSYCETLPKFHNGFFYLTEKKQPFNVQRDGNFFPFLLLLKCPFGPDFWIFCIFINFLSRVLVLILFCCAR